MKRRERRGAEGWGEEGRSKEVHWPPSPSFPSSRAEVQPALTGPRPAYITMLCWEFDTNYFSLILQQVQEKFQKKQSNEWLNERKKLLVTWDHHLPRQAWHSNTSILTAHKGLQGHSRPTQCLINLIYQVKTSVCPTVQRKNLGGCNRTWTDSHFNMTAISLSELFKVYVNSNLYIYKMKTSFFWGLNKIYKATHATWHTGKCSTIRSFLLYSLSH